MNNLSIKGDWNIVKGKLKQKYAQLTENGLRFREGEEDELVGRIQKRAGEKREAAKSSSMVAAGTESGRIHGPTKAWRASPGPAPK